MDNTDTFFTFIISIKKNATIRIIKPTANVITGLIIFRQAKFCPLLPLGDSLKKSRMLNMMRKRGR